jgi:CBS domain-containing protein
MAGLHTERDRHEESQTTAAPHTETLSAKDIMNRHVVTVSARDKLQAAMELMLESHVTGLPVMNNADRCVGLISATDILRYEQDNAELVAEATSDVARYFDRMTQRWEDVRLSSYALEKLDEIEVDEIISHDLVFVLPDTPVTSVARKMLDQGVHRLLVLDDENYLLGLVTATDFVRLAAKGIPKKKVAARRRKR